MYGRASRRAACTPSLLRKQAARRARPQARRIAPSAPRRSAAPHAVPGASYIRRRYPLHVPMASAAALATGCRTPPARLPAHERGRHAPCPTTAACTALAGPTPRRTRRPGHEVMSGRRRPMNGRRRHMSCRRRPSSVVLPSCTAAAVPPGRGDEGGREPASTVARQAQCPPTAGAGVRRRRATAIGAGRTQESLRATSDQRRLCRAALPAPGRGAERPEPSPPRAIACVHALAATSVKEKTRPAREGDIT